MAVLPNLPPLRVLWYVPPVVMAARVNIPGPILYPIQDIAFDGVTTGAYTDCQADMLVTFGSAAGLDDYGRGRLRAAPTATTLKVGRASQGYEDGQLNIVNDAYITVYRDFRVDAKISTIVDYVEYKDTDIPVSDLTEEPPPIANMGPDRAWRIDAGTSLVRFYFTSAASFAVADGASIVSVAWEIDDGSFVLGTTATDTAIYADFPAGVRYVSLTVTDSNGKTHTTRRLVLADDPDDSLCVSGMQATNLARTQQGTTARLRVLQDLPRADYPDGAHILIWEDRDPAVYGSPDPTDHSSLLFTGWHQRDEASSRADERYLRRETEMTCVDVLGRLDSLPGFHQRLEVPDAEAGLTWGEMPAANMDKFLCYLIHWHSTAASVADFMPSGTWAAYPFVLFDAVGDSLYSQLQRQANRIVPDHNFTAGRYGQMAVVVEPQLQDPADRTSTIQASITEQGWQEIQFGYQRAPRVHTLRGSALLTQDAWIGTGADRELLSPVFCVAPGFAPGQGAREATLGERLAVSQTALNRCIGHHYARMNARYGQIEVTLNSNADPWDFDPAAGTWVYLVTSAATAPQRGLEFASTRCLCQQVSIDYSYGERGTTWRGRVTLEPETVGLPALTENQEAALPVGQQPTAPTPPDFGLITDQEKVAAISSDGMLYTTPDFQTVSGSGGPTWAETDLSITDTKLFSFVVDPFSPGYINGTGTGEINGWVVGETNIWRVTDLFGTPSASIVHTFSTAISASSVFVSRTIGASFGRYFPTGSENPWVIVVSHYADASGHTGTWATYSINAGITWSTEVQLSAGYDTDVSGNDPANVPALYLSPRVPGLAYSAAYAATGSPATSNGFVTYDWGQTWASVGAAPVDDPAYPQPHWALMDATDTIVGTSIGPSMPLSSVAAAGPGENVTDGEWKILLAPPANAVRVEVSCSFIHTRTQTHTVGKPAPSFAQTYDLGTQIHTSIAEDLTFVAATVNGGPSSQSYTVTWTKTSGADWEGNRDQLVSSPPTSPSGYARFRVRTTAATFDWPGESAINTLVHSAVVTEIELADGTIYAPPGAGAGIIAPIHRLAGDIHIPWQDNADEAIIYYGAVDRESNFEYSLQRVESDGTTITDVSPVLSGRSYGVNGYGFAIRAYDSDRQKVLVAGRGNGASADTDDDYVGVFVSDDAGDTWTAIVTPSNSTDEYHAAFAGDDSDVLFLWSANGYVAYSSDFGSAIDSRTGNLGSFTPEPFIGLAGGPTS